MGISAGFVAGFLTAVAMFFAALGGVFAKALAGEDDFDADDDPADVMYPPQFPREV